MLEGLTLGALLCGVLVDQITKRLETPVGDAIEALRTAGLPQNHHIQRAVRRSSLLATRCQINRYLDRLKEETGSDLPDDSQHFQRPLSLLGRMVFKSRFWAVKPVHEMTDLSPISVALGMIGGRSLTAAEAEVSKGLAETAELELLSMMQGWDALPAGLSRQWQDPKNGWMADFQAWIAEALKKDDEFRRIWNSLVKDQGLSTLRMLDAFQRGAAQDVSDRLDRIDSLLRSRVIQPRDVDRIFGVISSSEEEFVRLIEALPVGRRHDGALASADVEELIARLSDGFAGRDADLDRIWEFVAARTAEENAGILIVTAPAGFGKSSLAAAWCTMASADPAIHVVRHFANQLSPRHVTTEPRDIHDHLAAQLAPITGEAIDGSGSANIISVMLERGATDGKPLMLWLDGLDEVTGGLPPFLPPRLAPGTVVIVSARANHELDIPVCLQPWIEIASQKRGIDSNTVSHRLHLEKLCVEDIEELAVAAFKRVERPLPDDLSVKVYTASEGGYALFAKAMVEDAVQASISGSPIYVNHRPTSIVEYIARMRDKLTADQSWPRIGPNFIILSVLKEGIAASTLGDISGVDATDCRSWPPSFRRWLTIFEPAEHGGDPMIGFAHPMLSEMFARAFGKAAKPRAHKTIADKLDQRPWSDYALRYLPTHLIAADALGEAASIIHDETYIEARIAGLSSDVASMQRGMDLLTLDTVKGLELTAASLRKGEAVSVLRLY